MSAATVTVTTVTTVGKRKQYRAGKSHSELAAAASGVVATSGTRDTPRWQTGNPGEHKNEVYFKTKTTARTLPRGLDGRFTNGTAAERARKFLDENTEKKRADKGTVVLESDSDSEDDLPRTKAERAARKRAARLNALAERISRKRARRTSPAEYMKSIRAGVGGNWRVKKSRHAK